MKILLLTAGTRGDVEPFLALARAAVARGHSVRTAIPDNSGVDVGGLDTVSLRMDLAQFISEHGVSPGMAAKEFRTAIRPAMSQLLSAAVEHIVEFAPDVVVYHPKVLSAPIAAQRLGIPSVLVETIPSFTATREFPAPFISRASLGPLNRMTYRFADVATLMFRRELDQAVKDLPPAPRTKPRPDATMIPISPQLLPRPVDWPDSVHLTGHWSTHPPAGEEAADSAENDQELLDFLDGGDFAYAGFGSMKAGDPRALGTAIVEAARRNGLRVVAATGWGGIDVPPNLRSHDVLVRESVDHSLVLPRAAAAIHHGGAGTTHAVVRAGVPSVVVPFIADQPFWGYLLHQRDLGPEPVPYRKATTARLAHALAHIGRYREQAAHTGSHMRRENGTAVALDVLESLARS
ncbi:glycosyltransferase [Arthrobacter sp. JZ12]|uniref:glycosyltransferase n=1 Tax=Arthrobacter sp. JZ12 TaxID=2654190 RepID=UPI002B492E16|nr:glycosyltransferase [Arthrobacter sp. JZ12]WRH24453.1 glycosyltransferase [Arthrobacter sp. JZ12]